ncbi:hemolysin-adenylate cyclase [Magnetospirillum fulvum]|uniref:Hemolysin-adenylate cyclase n=1 Tax=Magnetospirillum fulvum MGU-K5 TaxID=1316936 RepID=S9SA66_MAGFU|nr:hemolysin-adenylate cyclase [Magnetospirillum fulvum]EPY02797.1 hemolysin-adenylate cyclase [Magnetospirillum fulvum MGU-K5]
MAEAQQVKVIESTQGMFRLNMPQSAIARVDVVDIDLVLQTTSGERVILAGAAIDSTSEKPPSVMFSDGQVSTAQLFSAVAQVESPALPVPAMTSLTEYEAQKTKGPRSFVTNGEPKGESASASAADSPPSSDVPTNVAPLSSPPPTTVETLLADAKKTLDGESNKHGDFTHAPVPIPPQSPPSPPPSSPGAQATVPQLPTLQVWFGNYSDQVAVGQTVYGAGGTPDSDPRNFSTNAPLAANSPEQIAPEILTLTGNQTAYVDGVGPLLGTTGSGVNANATGYYAKVFMARVVGTFNSAGAMTISGLPLGFSLVSLSAAFTVVNTVVATASTPGVWTITLVDPTQTLTNFPLKLIYPTDASSTPITLDFAESVYYSGANYDLHQKIVIQVKEVHSASDLNVTVTDPNDATKTVAVNVLPSNGVPNLVYAQGSHNTIYGGIADDTMVSLGAANTFDGGGGINTVDFSRDATSHTINLATNANHGGYAEGSVLSHISVIKAGPGGDTITGNATTSTTIYGGAGNDVMAGGSAGDVFVGGGGRDTVTYAASAAPVTIDQTGGGRALGDASGDSYSAIATIIGSAGDDRFYGGTAAGSATMDGSGGSDWVDYQYTSVVNNRGVTVNLNDSIGNGGGALYDHLINIENIRGSTGNDLFYASNEANSFIGNGGTDIVSYDGQTALTIDQKSGRGLGTGAASGDSYTGIATLVGTTGDDTFVGGTDAGSALMDGARGNNWISYNYVGSSSVTVNLASGTSSGSGSNDRFVNVENVYGSGGNDLFYADTHANSFIGGGGTDVVSYAGQSAVTVDQTGGNRGTGAASGDSYTGIATIIGSSGNDTFVGGRPSDVATMDGSGGDNWVTYQNASGAVTLDLTGTAANGGAAQLDHIVNIENVVGSSFADLFYADSAANSFVGGGGHDTVSYDRNPVGGMTIDMTGQGYGSGYASGDSYSGISVVIGSSSSDTFIGGLVSGVGTMDGGSTANDTVGDWIDYEYVQVDATLNRGVTVNLDTGINGGSVITNAAANDRLVNIENVKGTSGNDLFYASSAANSFVGGSGNDVVSYAGQSAVTIDQTAANRGTGAASGDSYNGIETIIGSSGDDTFFGGTAAVAAMDGGANGAGGDWVSYAGEAAATVDLTRTSANGGSAANNSLINIENIVGSSNNDTFYANGSANSFVGGGGTGDVVSYARDGSGTLTIDLTGTTYSTGYASGDSYNGIATVIGSGGNDTFIGGAWSGVGTAIGGGGTDWISYKHAVSGATVDLAAGGNAGSAATNHLSGIENIIASDHGDSLTGDAQANSFISGAGADVIDGGDGRDTVDYSSDIAAHVINLTTNTNSGGHAAGDHLSNIEVVIGGSLNDTLTGDALQSTTLFGGAGDDTLAGGSGADYFDGGVGNDVVTYAGGPAVTVDQTTGNHGSGAAAGDQYVNIETIVGSSGVDTFVGGTSLGSATMDGGGGRDWIDYEFLAVGAGVTVNLASGTTSGAVTTDRFVNIENVYGSVNNDVFIASGQGNTFNGGGGSDWVSYAQNGGVAVTIDLFNHLSSGGASNDSLIAIQNLIGSTASDTFYADGNNNSFIGGGGTDVVSYSNSTVDLIIDQTQSGIATGLARGDGYSGIATIVGSSLSDTFIGGTASGSATMDGAGGENWVSYQNATSGATVNLATGANAGSALNDHFINVKNIIASAYGDKLTGDSNNNTFIAGAGADTFTGGGGVDVVSYAQSRDSLVIDQAGYGRGTSAAAGDAYSGIATIIGSTSVDTFIGGTAAGSATMFGGGGADWISYQYLAGGTGVTVDLLNNSNNSGAAANDRTNGIENVIGSSYADLFYADGETNSFIGGSGNDVVSYVRSGVLTGMVIDQTGGNHGTGFAANDYYSSIETIAGSQYDDTFIGGTASVLATMDGGVGSDWVDYEYVSGASGATVDLTNSLNNGGAAVNDRLTNVENIKGTANADLFYASTAVNSFVGNGGLDTVSYARAGSAVTVDQTGGNHGSGYGSGDSYSGIATIVGSAADDTFIGGTGAGSATMDGATGLDWVDYEYVSGASGVTVDLTDSLNNNGAAVNDRLSGIENIKGTANADLFYASAAANSFVGNGGLDVVSYARAASAVTIDQTAGNHGGGYASGDSFSGIATIVGSAAADTFIGGTGAGSATMDGAAGSNWVDYRYLTGGAGVTVNLVSHVNGGAAANDKLTNIENVYGSIYADTFVADGAGNSFVGNGGADWVSYAALTDTSRGVTVDLSNNANNAGSSALDRLSNVENIIGSGGNDRLIGDAFNNTFVGGLGADYFDGGSGGLDVVTYASSSAGLSIDLTGGGHGTLEAQGDSFVRIATIVGSAQADTFMSGTGTASLTMSSGGGADWVSYQYATGAVTVDLTYNGTTSLNGGAAQYDHLIGIENVRGRPWATPSSPIPLPTALSAAAAPTLSAMPVARR